MEKAPDNPSLPATAEVIIEQSRGEPRCSRYTLRRGLGLQALAARGPLPIEFDCREADCGICIIRVVAGAENLAPPTTREADFLKAMHADADERLACQTRILGDVTLRVDTQ